MKKIQLISVLAACFFMLAACKQGTDKPADPGAEVKTETTDAPGAKGKYSLKSAKVTSEMELPGGMGKNTTVLYFDDHGKKEMRENTTSIAVAGKSMNTTTRTIIGTDYIYTWEVGKQTGMKIKLSDRFDPSNMDYEKMTEEMRAKFKMKDEGTAEVLGKTCKVISFEAEGMKGKTYAWENIPLKVEMSMQGKTMVSEVTDIQENISIDASQFEVPADVEFKEMQMPKMPA
jgi:hypothetical protein